MGFFDRFRKKGAPEIVPEPEPEEPEPPPDVVCLARRGMDVPDDSYIEEVLRADCPQGMAAIRVPLSQPRWPQNGALMDSTVSAIIRAMAREHGIDPQKSSYLETHGPDGAGVILVMLWR